MMDVTLREYLEAILAEREKRTTQLERDAKDALEKASVALEKRLDLLNEFRAQASEEQAKFSLKAETNLLRADVEAIRRDHVSRREFELVRAAQGKMIGALVLLGVVVPVMVALVTHYL